MDRALPGDIIGLIGLKDTVTGDTHCEQGHPIILDTIIPPEPVIFVSIESRSQAEQKSLDEALQQIMKEDPTFQVRQVDETNQTIIAGMGELHLEIAIKDLRREHRLDVFATEPTVVYRETIQNGVGPFMGKSPNKHNRLWFDVEPLDPAIIELIRNGELSELSSRRQREEILNEKAGWTIREARRLVSVSVNASILSDQTSGIQDLREVIQHVSGGFHWSLESGPYAGEAVRGVHVKLMDAQLHEDPVHRGPAPRCRTRANRSDSQSIPRPAPRLAREEAAIGAIRNQAPRRRAP